MKGISKTDITYIAGFFDGEGCVCTMSSSHRLSISMCQKFPNVLYHIHKIIKLGRVRKRHSYTRLSSTHYLTITNQKQIKSFIDLILPYSIVKKNQLKVAMKIVKLTKNSGIHLTEEERIQKQLLCDELPRLKKQDYEPTWKTTKTRKT